MNAFPFISDVEDVIADSQADAIERGHRKVIQETIDVAAQWLHDAEAALQDGDMTKVRRAWSGLQNEIDGLVL